MFEGMEVKRFEDMSVQNGEYDGMEWNEMKMEWEDCMKIDGFVKYASRKFSDTVRSHVHAWITAIVFDCGNE